MRVWTFLLISLVGHKFWLEVQWFALLPHNNKVLGSNPVLRLHVLPASLWVHAHWGIGRLGTLNLLYMWMVVCFQCGPAMDWWLNPSPMTLHGTKWSKMDGATGLHGEVVHHWIRRFEKKSNGATFPLFYLLSWKWSTFAQTIASLIQSLHVTHDQEEGLLNTTRPGNTVSS